MIQEPTEFKQDEKKNSAEQISIATDILQKNIAEIEAIINDVIGRDEKIPSNPPSWLFLQRKTAYELRELFQKRTTLESATLLNQTIDIFFNGLTPKEFLLDISNYDEIISDIEAKLKTKLKVQRDMLIEGVDDEKFKKKYVCKDQDVNFIFAVAEIIFYITSKLNFLSYQCTLTYEWCKIQQLKKVYIDQASENLSKMSRQVALVVSTDDENLEIKYLQNKFQLLENYFKDLSNKKIALKQMMSATDGTPLTSKNAFDRWKDFIQHNKPKKEFSPLRNIQKNINDQLTGAGNLELKLALDFDIIEKKTDQFVEVKRKNDLSFQQDSSILSSTSFLAIDKSDEFTDLTPFLEEIQQQLPQIGRFIFRQVDKQYNTFYLGLKKSTMELNESYNHYANLYETICPQEFKSYTSRSERQKEYAKQYNILKEKLNYYRDNLLPLKERLQKFLQEPSSALLKEKAKIAELEENINELEQNFIKGMEEKISPVVTPQRPAGIRMPQIITSQAVLPAIIPARPSIWCCLFPCCRGDSNSSRTPLLTKADRNVSINHNNSVGNDMIIPPESRDESFTM